MRLWYLRPSMLIDYLERLRREPKSVRATATYIISLSLTAVVTFIWLIARSVTPAVTSTASAPKGVEAIRERFETLLPTDDTPQKEIAPPRQTIEEILRSRARSGKQGAPSDVAPLPPAVPSPAKGGELESPNAFATPTPLKGAGTLESDGILW